MNVAGDNLVAGDQLILKVTTGGSTPPSQVPEPASLLLLGTALLGLPALRARRRFGGGGRSPEAGKAARG